MNDVVRWPWNSDRVEFVLLGFGEVDRHLFAFQRVKAKTSSGGEVDRAKCDRCGASMFPSGEEIKDHGRLHLAVVLAKRP